MKELENEIINQRHQRDNREMRQLKLRRKLTRLNKTKDRTIQLLEENNKTKIYSTSKTNN